MKRASEFVDNAESAILSPVYFPFTFLSPTLAEALSVLFDHVFLYQPVGSTLPERLQPWVSRDFLQLRTPFSDLIDKKALSARLQECRAWGAMHQGANLAYMKQVRDHLGPTHPEMPSIVSEIRHKAEGKTLKKPRETDFSVQLFLHLAQEFDQQSWELGEALNRFKLQQMSLEALLHMDSAGEREHVVCGDALLGSNEDLGGVMTKNRVAAWSHLFREDPPESPLLFTDSPAVHAWLLEATEENIEILRLPLPSPEQHTHQLPWKKPLQDLLHKLLMTPWSNQLQEAIEETRDRIGQMIEHSEEPMAKPSEKISSFIWILVPKQSPITLLNVRCGTSKDFKPKGRHENAIVGLVEHGAPS